jgi:hypothetical protein
VHQCRAAVHDLVDRPQNNADPSLALPVKKGRSALPSCWRAPVLRRAAMSNG